jgi:hypothetical protein
MERSAQPFPSGARCEGGRAGDAEEAQLPPEVVGHVLRAVVVAEREAAGDVLAERAEAAAHALAHRIEGLEAVRVPGGMDADARSTRRLEVRTPAWRSLAQTFLCPSPWKELAARTARIASASAASGIGPTGPGRRGGTARGGARCLPVDGGARRPPNPAHPGEAVRPAGAGGKGAAHGLDLRRAEGRPSSRCRSGPAA